MNNNSAIYWFSGTGNSLYAARKLSAQLGNIPLIQITDEPPSGSIGGEGAKVGFVFPSYYCNLPRAVHYFIEKLDIRPGTYIFVIVTMGGPGQGSVAAAKRLLKAKGLRLNYGKGISMSANNVLYYDPADPSKGETTKDNTDKHLSTFAKDISAGKQLVRSHPFVLRNHFKNIEKLDAPFNVGDACTSCGLCEKVCPVKNIRMAGAKPEWLHHCELCVACISWCPAKAIEYGDKTQSRRRYRNPFVKVSELMRESSPMQDK